MNDETTLTPAALYPVAGRLREANLAFSRRYPGEAGERQPVHVVYGGAHLFKRDSAAKLGALALRSLEEYAPDAATLARVFDMPDYLASAVHARVAAKLRREAVEDYRIDFEDGYGLRPDAEEDGHAVGAAREMAAGLEASSLPPFCGFRIKALAEETRDRAVRTLDLFLTALLRASGGRLPAGLVVTLPKVTIPAQVAALADLFDVFEPALGLPSGALRLEIMVETPQSVLDLPALAEAARGRCVAAHFGTYDYTAALGISAQYQTSRHPACDFARQRMQAALAGTGIRIADGATTVLPIPSPLRAAAEGEPPLGSEEIAGKPRAVHDAWKLHYENVGSALVLGFYQGWDLHPAQLVPRYAALHAFFLAGLEPVAERLRNFVERAARATRVREVFDDAATGQGLLNFFLRGVQCGAIPEAEATAASGLTLEELRGKSFGKILERRSRLELRRSSPPPHRRRREPARRAARRRSSRRALQGERRVLLLERTPDGGRKILVSGGGRCNILPSAVDSGRFVTDSSPNTLRKILTSWPLDAQRRFFEEEAGIPLALEPGTGKLFPVSNRSREVRDQLLALARRRGVEIRFGALVEDLVPLTDGVPWTVRLTGGEAIAAAAVIVATGGLSLPGSGSDGTGFAIVERLGHTLHPTNTAQTPLTLDPPRYAPLAGISRPETLFAPGAKRAATAHGGFLFTHRGYSGPAVLDLSHLAVRSRASRAGRRSHSSCSGRRSTPTNGTACSAGEPGSAAALLRRHLPDRLAEALLADAGVDGAQSLARLRREERRRLVAALARHPLPWTGDGGYAKAEVTGGGVPLSEIDPRTLESRRQPGLFLCGEILDAFGPIGGYNFLWAWASGHAAGLSAAGSWPPWRQRISQRLQPAIVAPPVHEEEIELRRTHPFRALRHGRSPTEFHRPATSSLSLGVVARHDHLRHFGHGHYPPGMPPPMKATKPKRSPGLPPVIAIERTSAVPLYRQLYDRYREAIVERRLRPGERLPSTRTLAAELGISRMPVLNAFEQLLAEGYFEARVGAGTFVASSLPDVRPAAAPAQDSQPPERPAPRTVSQRSGSVLRAAPEAWLQGWGAFRVSQPAVDRFPFQVWSALVARHSRNPRASRLNYGSALGDLPFREAVADYLRTSRAVRCDAGQIMVVSGSQQALEIATRVLLDPGDRVWMEEPGYSGARDVLTLAGARDRARPRRRRGAGRRRGDRPRPAGAGRLRHPLAPVPARRDASSASRRLQLLALGGARGGAWIFEDDYDSEYRYESLPIASLQGLDRDARVIYIGTFSKVLFPAVRIGYLVIPPDLVARFAAVREAMDIFPPTLYQAVLADFLSEGHFARHLRRMRQLYRERRDALVAAVRRELGDELQVLDGQAGLHLVAALPDGTDDLAISLEAARQGLWAMPLSACYAGEPVRRGLVLGYGGTDVAEIPGGARRLRDVLRRALRGW